MQQHDSIFSGTEGNKGHLRNYDVVCQYCQDSKVPILRYVVTSDFLKNVHVSKSVDHSLTKSTGAE